MSRIDELVQELCPDGVEYKTTADVKIDSFWLMPATPNYVMSGVPYITSKNVKNNQIDFDDVRYIIQEDYINISANRSVRKNDLLITMIGTIGEAAFVGDFTEFYGQNLYLVRLNEDIIDRKYYYYFLTSPRIKEGLISKKNASSQGYIKAGSIENLQLPVPPLEVQREIVRILDSFTLLTAELTAELTARKSQYEFYRDNLLAFNSKIPMVTLGDIATDIYRGSGIKRDEVTEDGIPCIRYGEIYTQYNTWFNECVSHTQLEYVSSPKYFEHGDILFAITGESVEDIAKSIAYLGYEKCLAGGDIVVLKHEQEPRYLAHVLATYEARKQKSKGKIKSKVVHSSVPAIKEIAIPLPPLDVQKRYADVLDNFEEICNDLNIGLPAEIEARQKQYEYYRDALLTYAATGKIIAQTDECNALIKLCQYVFGVVFVNLSDIATITRGGNFQKKDFTDIGVPCIHYGQMYTHFGIYTTEALKCISEDVAKKSKMAVKNDIVMAVTSENVEDVCKCTAWLGNEDIAVSGHTAIIHHNQNAKYLSYYFHSSMFSAQKKRLAHGTKVIEVTPNALNDIVIPLPSLEEQERIVGILDRFDALCNDLSGGLPAEIEARQKQYEYYRDRLLNFEPTTK